VGVGQRASMRRQGVVPGPGKCHAQSTADSGGIKRVQSERPEAPSVPSPDWSDTAS
jgi:hypothetical protein